MKKKKEILIDIIGFGLFFVFLIIVYGLVSDCPNTAEIYLQC